jgi:ATP-dependent helicase/nuclease subunit B
MPKDHQSQAYPLPSLHFLAWEQPLAEGVAKLLIDQATEGAARDLSEHMVIVPSQFASRLLTEKLAQAAGERGVFLPRITTPSHFLNWGDAQKLVASDEEVLLTWVDILSRINRGQYPTLFAGGQTGPFQYEAALDFAKELIRLRDELGGSREGLDFSSMATRTDLFEGDRWNDLGKLENLYQERLKEAGKVDHNSLRRDLAIGDGHPAGIKTIWLAGLISPQGLLLRALEGILKRKQADVKVIVTGDSEELFDSWGQPKTENWKQRRVGWEAFSECVHVVPRDESAHERLIEILRKGSDKETKPTPGTVAIVPCDREKAPLELEYTVRKATGIKQDATANSLGWPHRDHEIHAALRGWFGLLNVPSYGNLRSVMLHPVLARALAKNTKDLRTNNLALDALSELHPPQGLAEAREFCEHHIKVNRDEAESKTKKRSSTPEVDDALLANHDTKIKVEDSIKDPAWKLVIALDLLDTTIAKLTTQLDAEWTKAAKDMLDLCKDSNQVGDFAEDVAENFIGVTERLAESSKTAKTQDALILIKLAIDTAGESRFRGDINPEAINLPGWQDAPWDPSPHMIVFGMTDNFVPGAKSAHAYLPASLRGTLGLTTPDQEFASAAYAFEQLWRRRANPNNGRLDVIVPQFTDEGEGLKPSRLLFLAPIEPADHTKASDALLGRKGRVDKLFKKLPQEKSLPSWEIPKACLFDPAAAPEKAKKVKSMAAATDFGAFMKNAPEYWMKKALGMSETDHGAIQLNAAEFGTMLHSVLESYAKAKKTTKGAGNELDLLLSCADEVTARQLGENPSQSLKIQIDTARSRMRAIAAVEAEIEKEWETVAVESWLPELIIPELGFKLYGRMDRLDRHKTDKNRWRVYDYKSSNNPDTPKEAHLVGFMDTGDYDPDYVKETDGKKYKWFNVQLIVYEWCLREGKNSAEKPGGIPDDILNEIQKAGAIIEVAYINIAPEEHKTALEVWGDFEIFKTAGREAVVTAATKLHAAKPDAYANAALRNASERFATFPGLYNRELSQYMLTNNFGQERQAR